MIENHWGGEYTLQYLFGKRGGQKVKLLVAKKYNWPKFFGKTEDFLF